MTLNHDLIRARFQDIEESLTILQSSLDDLRAFTRAVGALL